MNSDSPTPYWVLISVLFSSVSLTPALAQSLYEIAYELHRSGEGEGEVNSDLAYGKVRNLRKSTVLGPSGGPAFEAELETERGHAIVRFFLTREGLRLREGEKPALMN